MQNAATRGEAEAAAGDLAAQLERNNISRRALHGIHLRSRSSYNMNAMQNAAARRDRLSELPDNILLDILERVNTLDALRTCTLSKRLMRLPAMFSRFDIDIGSLTCHHNEASHGNLTVDHLVRYNNIVASVTEKILCARNLEIPTIHKLRVTCYLRPDECLPITRAFADTMATHKVDNAEFVPLVEKSFSECTLGNLLCNAKRFNICLGDCPAAFAGLTSLWLSYMRFRELDISNILSTCKRLKHLRLLCCDGGYRRVLLVEHDQLVELNIEKGQFERVHLSRAPKLQRLTCDGWCYPAPLAFGYVPQLSKLSLVKRGISSTFMLQLSHLLANVPSIRDLHLDFQSEKIWVVPECSKLLTPVLRKLEIVNLDNLPEGCDIAWTMFILEAAPCLRELCIRVWDHWCEMVREQDDDRRKHGYCEKANVEWRPLAPGFKHMNLLKLTIYGFQPDESMVRYVRRIREVAVNIREISLHDRKACGRCGDMDPKTKVITRCRVYPNNLKVRRMISI
uniref:Uncharacterized protein n=2 Tax=Avena sativa TaxID=4498 RepID=A0ACD6A008_AVESA